MALGLRGSDQKALAHQIRSLHHLERGDGQTAELELTAALTPTPFFDPDEIIPIRRAELHNLLSQAFRRQGRYEAAYAEVEKALILAREMGLEPAIQRYAAEKELIEKHAGRSLSGSLPEATKPR